MTQCNEIKCEREGAEGGVYFRSLIVAGVALSAVPLCQEHYEEIRAAQAVASWGTNY